jgi:hypothetical protein
MTLGQIMQAHTHARARSARVPFVRPGDPRCDELEAKFARLLSAEDAILNQLASEPCASDEEFFEKAAFILQYVDSGDDADWAALRLADATRLHLKQRGAE